MTEKKVTETMYSVVVNHEEQYSIWPGYRAIPAGWRDVGVSGTEEECLSHIEQTWTDMRPLSLRKFMQENQPYPALQ
jgi:MbtH protein